MPPPRRESPSEERLEPKKEVKETRKEEEEMPETQEKAEQEEGRERSRRAAAVKATQTLQANESVSVTGGAQGLEDGWSWASGCGREGRAGTSSSSSGQESTR